MERKKSATVTRAHTQPAICRTVYSLTLHRRQGARLLTWFRLEARTKYLRQSHDRLWIYLFYTSSNRIECGHALTNGRSESFADR